ncbi:hypothetical protein HF072_17170 [Bacillus sp. RO3]|nr:hypothetical protein [Bacillus sp. RO3]
MKCHKCRNQLEGEANYCTHCGEEVIGREVSDHPGGSTDPMTGIETNTKAPSKKKLFLIGGLSFVLIGMISTYLIISQGQGEVSNAEKVQQTLDEDSHEAKASLSPDEEEEDTSGDGIHDLNGYWYNEEEGHFVSFMIHDENSGEMTKHRIENYTTYTFERENTRDGLIEVVVKDMNDRHVNPYTLNIMFEDRDAIVLEDRDGARRFIRSNEEALFNQYSEFEEGELTEHEQEDGHDLNISEGDGRIPDVVAVGLGGNTFEKEILESFFAEENMTYSFLESSSLIIDGQNLGSETSYREYAADLLMGFDYTDDFGDSLLYTQPYKKNGNQLVVFALSKEDRDLHERLDRFIGALKDSGEFEEMYRKHIYTELDEEIMKNQDR